jgi:hypothetical protein
MLKTLISIACIVIIVAGSVFLYNAWADAKARRDYLAGREAAREELFILAQASTDQSAFTTGEIMLARTYAGFGRLSPMNNAKRSSLMLKK